MKWCQSFVDINVANAGHEQILISWNNNKSSHKSLGDLKGIVQDLKTLASYHFDYIYFLSYWTRGSYTFLLTIFVSFLGHLR